MAHAHGDASAGASGHQNERRLKVGVGPEDNLEHRDRKGRIDVLVTQQGELAQLHPVTSAVSTTSLRKAAAA